MSKVNELFGFPLADKSERAEDHRRRAWCPFRNDVCDGGGNRYLSQAKLDPKQDKDLIEYFQGKTTVQAGVCSLDFARSGRWIVCPRRLFTFPQPSTAGDGISLMDMRPSERQILRIAGLAGGQRYGVWREVKLKHEGLVEELEKIFDYTFDYVIVPLRNATMEEVGQVAPSHSLSSLAKAGYAIRGGKAIEDVPLGPPLVIEIMTSSTSGGNAALGTTITQAFKAAVRRASHNAPGINKRQVWARMVSQLIVKSQVTLGWGGRTIWIVQDVLANYIRSTTGLDLRRLVSSQLREVNMAACGYDEMRPGELALKDFYAGTIDPEGLPGSLKGKPYFLEIIKAPMLPPLSSLQAVLLNSKPHFTLKLP